jgi:L-asparagine oxygenase
MENNQTSVGSTIELEVHTEQAFSRFKPDLLSLGCLRGDLNAFTYILPVGRILDNLESEEIELLFRPLWKTKVDLSFKLNGNEFIDGDVRGPLSILNGSLLDPTLVFDQDLMFGTTEFAEVMIAKIVDIYYNHRIKYNLQPGEIILIDNNRAIHGRSSFFPRYDGNDRFLLRSFATFDYKKSAYARPEGERFVSAIYS